MVRRAERIDWVHYDRDGHAWQSVIENLILITSFFRLSIAGIQLMLVCPSGHRACCCANRWESDWHRTQFVERLAIGSPFGLVATWINLIVPLALHQELCVHIASIHKVFSW